MKCNVVIIEGRINNGKSKKIEIPVIKKAFVITYNSIDHSY